MTASRERGKVGRNEPTGEGRGMGVLDSSRTKSNPDRRRPGLLFGAWPRDWAVRATAMSANNLLNYTEGGQLI